MKKYLLLLLVALFLTPVFSQEIEPFTEDTEEKEKPVVIKNEKSDEQKKEMKQDFEKKLEKQNDETQIIGSRYKRKSPVGALFMSAVVPGAGQFYVDKTSVSSYIFMAVDVALIYLMHDFNKKGDDIEEDYKRYAELHYNSVRQFKVQQELINIIPATAVKDDHYNQALYGLDTIEDRPINEIQLIHENGEYRTQHFYEDIGKYNRYIFGWDDWGEECIQNYDEFKINPATTDPFVEWIWRSSDPGVDPEDDPDHTWIGNASYTNDQDNYKYTANRAVYIRMRQDAEEEHDKATMCSFMLFGNHLVSSIHARIAARNYNAQHLTTSTKTRFHITSKMYNNNLTPVFMLTKRF